MRKKEKLPMIFDLKLRYIDAFLLLVLGVLGMFNPAPLWILILYVFYRAKKV